MLDKFKKIEEALEAIKKYSKSRISVEVCGFIGSFDGEYVVMFCENVSEDPREYFAIDPIDFLNFKSKCKLGCVFHSHVNGDENPSEFDIVMSENCAVPFMIYSLNTDKFKIYSPEEHDADIELLQEITKKV